MGITQDGRAEAEDVYQVIKKIAVNLFIFHCFITLQICDLPNRLQASGFDMNVNLGLLCI
jgi:hypothetical protein